MTVNELINILTTMPQDALIVTEGYEDGYDTVKKISVISVEENPVKDWWVGKYTDATSDISTTAVFLNAETRADNK
jgi:hypothetical protein